MNAPALLTGLLGAALGTGVCYRLTRREWWAAGGLAAIGAFGLLLTVTEGNRSHVERVIVFAVSMGLLLLTPVARTSIHARAFIHARALRLGAISGTG